MTAIADGELTLTRLIDSPREKLYRCRTEPALLVQWFTPNPWTTVRTELDVRPGGASLVVMRSPEGAEFPNRGVYHWSVADREAHEKMGFHEGWGKATDQLAALAKTI